MCNKTSVIASAHPQFLLYLSAGLNNAISEFSLHILPITVINNPIIITQKALTK